MVKKQIGIFRNTDLYSNMNINIWRPYTLIDTDKLNIIFDSKYLNKKTYDNYIVTSIFKQRLKLPIKPKDNYYTCDKYWRINKDIKYCIQ